MLHRSLRWSNQPRRAGPEWTMEEIVMSRMKQINLRGSGEFQLLARRQSWRGRSIFRQIMLCSQLGAKCVTQETDNQGTGEARTGWTQNLLRLLLHVWGRSCYSDACVEIQQIREENCHSVGGEELDAVWGEVLCRLHLADWNSKVHQQEWRRTGHEGIERCSSKGPRRGRKALDRSRQWEITKRMVTSSQAGQTACA